MAVHNKAVLVLTAIFLVNICACANILMVTLGGTKSHKIPFLELARGLIPRGHNITFMNAFPPDFYISGLEEITPSGLIFYARNYTDWDLLGPRLKGQQPLSLYDIIRYGPQACDAFLEDSETQHFLHSGRSFDLLLLDGAFPECALFFARMFNAPFIYVNTVAFYTGSIGYGGSPVPYATTPVFFAYDVTDNMNVVQKVMNTGMQIASNILHNVMVRAWLQNVLHRHFGPSVPPVYEMAKNVSFILQNGHFSVTYPRPYLPNVAEIACIHCKAARPLPKDLENFINGSESGFIYVSMGSSVREANMPDYLRHMFLRVFGSLPYQVLWKWDSPMTNIPQNVKVSRWLPQQDILGHKKIRAFITHGGLLSMFETVYHGVPVVSVPVFCDHDVNAAKAESDGYAIKLDFQDITSERLLLAINKVINNPKYKKEVLKRQQLLRDQKETPMERALYWMEYVLRHKGAAHLQSPARDMNMLQYYLVDVICIVVLAAALALVLLYTALKFVLYLMIKSINTDNINKNKLD